MPDEAVEVMSLEQLAALLARDDAAEWTGVFHDVVFEVYERGHGHVEPARPAPLADSARAAVSGGLLVVDVIGNLLEAGKSGWYVRVWLPAPLAMDLLVSRREPADGPGFEGAFEVRAANRPYALRRLAPLAPILVSFAQRYDDVVLRDAALELGPLDRDARETAADLAVLIDTLALLAPPDDIPGAERQSAFCHFCGHGVAEDTRACPRCGERLDEDDPP